VALVVYLLEQRLFFSANHVFSGVTGRRTAADFETFARLFPAFETSNGCMLSGPIGLRTRWHPAAEKTPLGGSDAHAITTAGTASTEAPGACARQEFVAALRAGTVPTAGISANYVRLTRDVLSVGAGMVMDNPLTAPVALLGLLVPVITLLN
jgi:hypothetical protein